MGQLEDEGVARRLGGMERESEEGVNRVGIFSRGFFVGWDFYSEQIRYQLKLSRFLYVASECLHGELFRLHNNGSTRTARMKDSRCIVIRQ